MPMWWCTKSTYSRNFAGSNDVMLQMLEPANSHSGRPTAAGMAPDAYLFTSARNFVKVDPRGGWGVQDARPPCWLSAIFVKYHQGRMPMDILSMQDTSSKFTYSRTSNVLGIPLLLWNAIRDTGPWRERGPLPPVAPVPVPEAGGLPTMLDAWWCCLVADAHANCHAESCLQDSQNPSTPFWHPFAEYARGSRMGDGACEGLAECKLSVWNRPRYGLVQGVKVNLGFEAGRDCGESSLPGPASPMLVEGTMVQWGGTESELELSGEGVVLDGEGVIGSGISMEGPVGSRPVEVLHVTGVICHAGPLILH
ncbi:hypothetical protein EDD16DRAFT_1525172 [Pisolithus croceorrhizus]|nr:hypothetical protein EDD16DRAFT_1525172 [Pisolithus croceorrhizus]KAI6107263.1 hypothetical protein EV401DRAFT_1892175 [Pisolithus croceorrhizus]KAI6162763.1 hypothetical protein EDD17DRAFT_1507649 [Pisolithus thermaeus]